MLRHSTDLVSRLNKRNTKLIKKLGDNESSELSDLNPTPKNKRTKLRRTYAIADIGILLSDAAESGHEQQVLTDGYEPQSRPESRGHATDEDLSDVEPTPKKRQKTIKVPVREAINANRKECEPCKAENKVSRLIVI